MTYLQPDTNGASTATVGTKPIIIAKDVEKTYGNGFHVLKGVSLTVNKGEVVVLMGPSGSGKSTFIRTFNGLEPYQKGSIEIDGIRISHDVKNIEMVRREVGMVFQQFNLFPHLTVLKNITLGPIHLRRIPKSEAENLGNAVVGASWDCTPSEQVPWSALGGSTTTSCDRSCLSNAS
jgi:general L-amino acid transport system ATP-binding protein